MEYGVVVPSSYSAQGVITAAKAAEDSGLRYFFVTDHYMTPSNNNTVDAWSMLGALAVLTKNVRIGTCVTPIPFRPPSQLAKIVATVDQISQGRAILGVGCGWSKSEFLGFSSWDEDVNIRARKTREGLDLILALWNRDKPAVDYIGTYYSAQGAVLQPKPVQYPHVPLWFGTEGRYMLRTAARIASGWLPPVPGLSLEEYKDVILAIRKEEKRIGRKDHVKIACNGTISEFRSNLLEQYVKLGCEIALLAKMPEKNVEEEISEFARVICTEGF